MPRAAAIDAVLAAMQPGDFAVCALGYLSRDLFGRAGPKRARCVYCMGSMGSVAPFALGISLARPAARVLALEGDGSLLMNLGTLATLRRYGSPHVRLLVFDNGCYESTGGQPSQPEGFRLERICAATGLATRVATEAGHIGDFLADTEARVLVIKTAIGGKTPRIDQPPEHIAAAFARELACCPNEEVARPLI